MLYFRGWGPLTCSPLQKSKAGITMAAAGKPLTRSLTTWSTGPMLICFLKPGPQNGQHVNVFFPLIGGLDW